MCFAGQTLQSQPVSVQHLGPCACRAWTSESWWRTRPTDPHPARVTSPGSAPHCVHNTEPDLFEAHSPRCRQSRSDDVTWETWWESAERQSRIAASAALFSRHHTTWDLTVLAVRGLRAANASRPAPSMWLTPKSRVRVRNTAKMTRATSEQSL